VRGGGRGQPSQSYRKKGGKRFDTRKRPLQKGRTSGHDVAKQRRPVGKETMQAKLGFGGKAKKMPFNTPTQLLGECERGEKGDTNAVAID